MEGLHTREAVGYPHVLAVILSEEHTDYSPLGSLCLSAVVVCCREEDERRDGDVAGHERQRLSCGGGHLGDVDSVSPEGVGRLAAIRVGFVGEDGDGGCC